jgi:phasin family protein
MASHPRSSSSDIGETARRTTEHVARQVSEETERAAHTGAEALKRNTDRLNVSWKSGSEAANRIAERSMEQFRNLFGFGGEAGRQTMAQSSSNLQAVVESTSLVADGMQDVSGEWLRFAQDRMEQNMEHFDQFLNCRNPHEYVALQTRILRENFDALMQTTRRASERITQTVDQAARKVSEASIAPE